MTTERDPNQPPGDDSPTTAWTPPPNGTDVKPISAPSDPPRGGGNAALRWGIAGLLVVLIVATATVAIILTAGRAAPATLASYVAAADVAGYFEARLDLPGDQGEKLGAFLGRFPGFDDQSVDSRIDDALNELVRKATKNEQDWTTDIEPWFEGALGVAVTDDMMTTSMEPSRPGQPAGLFMLSIKDATKAEAWLSALAGKSDVSAIDYNGTGVYYGGSSPHRLAVGILGGRVMLAGDETSVHKAIDLGGKGSLGDEEQFKAARAAFTGDSLGFMYLDLERYLRVFQETSDPSVASPCISTAGYLEMVPDWMMIRFVARENGLAFETAFPHIDGAAQAENRLSRIAPHLPGSTIAMFEVHDVGRAILNFIDECRGSDPEVDAAIKEVEPQLQILGGLEGVLEWIGDVGVVVTRDGDAVDGGLVISTANRADADRLLGFVSSALELGGSSMGFDVRDEEYAGTTITILDFGDWQDLAALAGTPGEVPFEGRFEIGYAIKDDFVVLGLGDRFVKSALDAGPGGSLADNARFKALLDSVGAEGAGTFFLDLTGARELLEDLGSTFAPDGMAAYEQEVKPWLEPFDAYIQGSRRDGQYDRSTGILTVK
jgi:hypothetical protein